MADASTGYFRNVQKWRGSRAIQRMSFSERGVYQEMLDEQWDHKTLPDDAHKVAELIATTDGQAEEVLAAWAVVRAKFVVDERKPGRIYNVALEQTRREQRAYYRRRAEAGSRGGHARARNLREAHEIERKQNVALLESAIAHSSDKTGVGEDKKGSEKKGSEKKKKAPPDTTPPFLVFPVIGADKTWTLTHGYLARLKELYPGVDVEGECRRSLAWVEANELKTAGGMPSYLVRWLNRHVNNRPRTVPPEATNKRIAGMVAGGQEFLRKVGGS